MPRKRKSHTATLKAQVALAAVKGDKTVSELATLPTPTADQVYTADRVFSETAAPQRGLVNAPCSLASLR